MTALLDAPLPCPLCANNNEKQQVKGADARRYFRCFVCDLIFADPGTHLSRPEEQALYGSHENSIDSPGYVNFLKRLLDPMQAYLEPGMRTLDYGCGPGPTLSTLVRQQGLECGDYDPLFFPREFTAQASASYDAIFATECFEHFFQPRQEINTIARCLKPSALLGIMTELWSSTESFSHWYYTKDPTHVCFYHLRTIDYICAHFGFDLLWHDERRVLILRRTL